MCLILPYLAVVCGVCVCLGWGETSTCVFRHTLLFRRASCPKPNFKIKIDPSQYQWCLSWPHGACPRLQNQPPLSDWGMKRPLAPKSKQDSRAVGDPAVAPPGGWASVSWPHPLWSAVPIPVGQQLEVERGMCVNTTVEPASPDCPALHGRTADTATWFCLGEFSAMSKPGTAAWACPVPP